MMAESRTLADIDSQKSWKHATAKMGFHFVFCRRILPEGKSREASTASAANGESEDVKA
jgi:hypothetical protein